MPSKITKAEKVKTKSASENLREALNAMTTRSVRKAAKQKSAPPHLMHRSACTPSFLTDGDIDLLNAIRLMEAREGGKVRKSATEIGHEGGFGPGFSEQSIGRLIEAGAIRRSHHPLRGVAYESTGHFNKL